MKDDAYTKEALRLAGIMADAARNLVGGQGINFRVAPANVLSISVLSNVLQRAVDNYDDHIIKWHSQGDSI